MMYIRVASYLNFRGVMTNASCMGLLYMTREVGRGESCPDNPDRIPVRNFRYQSNSFVDIKYLKRLKER